MNPFDVFSDWLSRQSRFTLDLILLLCGVGAFSVLLYVLVSGGDSGFRVCRSRRRW